MKILFSIHVGDSIAHVLRTRGIARRFIEDGHDIRYVVSERAMPYLKEYINTEYIVNNEQNYGFSRLETLSNFSKKFCERAVVEYRIYREFKPDLIVGDMGLIASAYNLETPIIKIINRFPLEIYFPCETALSIIQKHKIVQQLELIINKTRSELGITEHFTYSDFVSTPLIINGAEDFIGYNSKNILIMGISLSMLSETIFTPNRSSVFISLGTGSAPDKIQIANKIIRLAEPYFEQMHINIGVNHKTNDFIFTNKCNIKPIFDKLPTDIGCIICHGGYGIIHTGLLLQLPTLAIPYHIEHYCNSKRMEALKGGKCYGLTPSKGFKGLNQSIEIDWLNIEDGISSINQMMCEKVNVKICDTESFYDAINKIYDSYYDYCI